MGSLHQRIEPSSAANYKRGVEDIKSLIASQRHTMFFERCFNATRHVLELYGHYVLVAIAALTCYVNSLNGQFVHDDVMAIVKNSDVRDISNSEGWWKMWRHDFWGQDISKNTSHKSYRPLTVLTFR